MRYPSYVNVDNLMPAAGINLSLKFSNMPRPKKEKQYLIDKRNELIWALIFQDYNGEDIAAIFNVHRSSVLDIRKKMPNGWKPKWRKI